MSIYIKPEIAVLLIEDGIRTYDYSIPDGADIGGTPDDGTKPWD